LREDKRQERLAGAPHLGFRQGHTTRECSGRENSDTVNPMDATIPTITTSP
jgi:hypothetical protein